MSFVRPEMLLLVLLPAVWAFWESRKTDRWVGLALKAVAAALVLLALAEPQWTRETRRLAVAVLLDESSSIPTTQLEQEQSWLEELRGAAGGAELRPLSFADTVRRGGPELDEEVALLRGTNLEAGLRDALAALPEGRSGRIVLASDGLENEGSVERAVYQARRRGVAVDVVPLPGRAKPDLLLDGVSIPSQAFVGEQFPVELTIESPGPAAATIQLSAEGRVLGTTPARLEAGRNLVRLRARLEAPGSALLQGEIVTPGREPVPFAGVVSLHKPRALLLSAGQAGGEPHLEQVLRASGFEITRLAGLQAAGDLRDARNDYDVIVADNQDFEGWPAARKSEMEAFVRQGGGFLLIAGENNLYVERESKDDDPLNRMLPAVLAPPRTPEGAAVALVLDKSSSMEGKKMQLARQSAMGVIDNLRPVDNVGVLAFDNSFQWTVPIRKNDDPEAIKQMIAGIIADGGTQIAPALSEAYRQIRPQEAVYRHILLLTDGISEEGDSIQLAREAAREKITISTIGLGQDVNRAYLERVASTAEGRSYMVIDVAQLAEVVLRDVLEHTGTSVTEREFRPKEMRKVELLDGVNLSSAGPLLGWVKFEAKDAAETILEVDDEQDPLLSRWQYGLGRSAVFASDAKNRWAANWIGWPGFDRFWANVLRDLLPRAQTIETETRWDPASGEIVITWRNLSGQSGAGEPPQALVLGPDGFRQAVDIQPVAAGVWEARLETGERYGLFRFRPENQLDRFPETAFFRQNLELERHGSDAELLQAIASATGGRFEPSTAEIFRPGAEAVQTTSPLWPWALVLALLLNLAELLGRKGWLPFLGARS
ncbi:MAG: VWA domain-containing protein [Acidobacteria bacterium]|nr:VWA domain-containing protein [Acidobacteriota bacterium]